MLRFAQLFNKIKKERNKGKQWGLTKILLS